MAREKVGNRRTTDRPESADGSIEEMLREIGADILDEPVPERLLRLLRSRDDPASAGQRSRREDGDSCG